MNGAHLHLLVNHVSLFAVAFGLLALAWAVWKGSTELKWASVFLFVLAGIFAWVGSETGEMAEEVIEHLPGVTKSLIHEHEEAAEWASILTYVLAAGSLLMAWLARHKSKFAKKIQVILLVVGVMALVALARTAFLGGHIRHPEVRDGFTAPSEGLDQEGIQISQPKDEN